MSSIDTPAGPSTKFNDTPSSAPLEIAGRSWPRPSLGTIVCLLVLLSLALRLWELGDRAFHHDESLDAWWSWLFRNGQYTEYDPVYHGPLRFYITAGFFELFGESEATARLFSALTGTLVVGLPWFLRHELGRAGTIAASVALCISPTMLYYSRFGREDAQMVFLTLLAMVLGLAYLRKPTIPTAAGLAFTLSCSFAIKESTYLFVLLLAVYLLVLLAAQFDAQNRRIAKLTDDESLNPAFMTSALLVAAVGLLIAVVVGSAADELFLMIGLYGAGLAAFTAVVAAPRLRHAAIEWTLADAALAFTSLATVLLVARASGAEPEPWSLSSLTLGLVVVFGVAAVALGILSQSRPTLDYIGRTVTAAAAAGVAAVGLGARELVQRAHTPENLAAIDPSGWSLSPMMLALGVLISVIGVVAWVSVQGGGPADESQTDPDSDPGPDPAVTRMVATAATLIGIAILANEYVEAESQRPIALMVVVAIVGAAILFVGALPRTTNPDFEWPPVLRSFGAIGWLGWLLTLFTFAASWFLFFTIWGRVKGDWASGFTRAIGYWDSQQEVNRGGQPWYYYLYALPAYEWMFVGLGLVGTWRALRRPTVLSGLFVWFAIGSLILYSYAGERMPWLIAHPLLPVLILAGLGIQHLWQHREHRAIPAIAAVIGFALLATTATSIRASFPNGADGREILSQAGQATPHLTAALERLENIDRLSTELTGEPAMLAIGNANAWPYSWYLRDRGPYLQWFDNQTGPPADGSADVIIGDHGVVDPINYDGYDGTLFAMRSWWVPTYHEAGVGGWVAWARDRTLWDQTPNLNFRGVTEVEETEATGGIRESLEHLRDGANSRSHDWVDYTGAMSGPVSELDTEPTPGRDGCGSVDQWFLVRSDLADLEEQVYPAPIREMGLLELRERTLGDLIDHQVALAERLA